MYSYVDNETVWDESFDLVASSLGSTRSIAIPSNPIFNFQVFDDTLSVTNHGRLRHGLYKFYVAGKSSYVKIDYRYCNVPEVGYGDIYLNYNFNTDSYTFSGNNVTNQTLLATELLGSENNPTNCFEPHRPYIQSITQSGDNNPVISWIASPGSFITSFKVKRSINNGSYTVLTNPALTPNTSSYEDNDIYWGGNQGNSYSVKYKVTSVNDQISNDSYHSEILIDPELQKKLTIGNRLFEFTLSQNHPNPFNPTTTIVYQTPIAGIVNLSVYNLLGEKIATPVNDYKEAGEYTVQFNASGLTSGAYIYTLTTNGNRISKKLSVMK